MGLAENLGPVALWWAWLSPSLGELFGSGFGFFFSTTWQPLGKLVEDEGDEDSARRPTYLPLACILMGKRPARRQ